MRLEGKVAIISGAASGMGAATARRFAKEGAKVVIADMLEKEGRQVAADITRANGTAQFMRLDVTNEDEWKAVVEATVQKYGKLDILVNNAGISGSAVSDMLDTDAWDKLMAVNSRGVFLGTKHAVLAMKQAGGGSIVNLYSIAGVTGSARTHMGTQPKCPIALVDGQARVRHTAESNGRTMFATRSGGQRPSGGLSSRLPA
jgi:3(or 17)beta-hydroxysteroid dehydrogenase